MPFFFKTARQRFLQSAVILGVLFLLEYALFESCILFPGNLILQMAACIAAIWTLFAGILVFVRFYRHVIKPCSEYEEISRQMARGDFSLLPSSCPREFFPELNRSIHLLRNRLQYLENALRSQQTKEQQLHCDGATAALQGRVHIGILSRLFQPLSLLGGYLELLSRNGKLSGEQLAAAEHQFARCIHLLQGIMNALEASIAADEDGFFDPGIFLRDIEEECRSELQRRQISLVCRYGTDMPPLLHGSRKWLSQQLKVLLEMLALEAEAGQRLELTTGFDGENFQIMLTDNGTNVLASEFMDIRELESGSPGTETPLPLLVLRLVANRAAEHRSTLSLEETGKGSRIILTLKKHWISTGERPERNAGRFTESRRKPAPPETIPGTDSGSILLIARDADNADILKAWHPDAEWTFIRPDMSYPDGKFTEVIAIVPVEIAARYLAKLETELCRAASARTPVIVFDPGLHLRFRRHLHESGIARIYNTRLAFREFGGVAERPGE